MLTLSTVCSCICRYTQSVTRRQIISNA